MCFIRYLNTSKSLKKNSAAPRFFNLLLSVWISDETRFLVFDILHSALSPVNHDSHRNQQCHTHRKELLILTSSNQRLGSAFDGDDVIGPCKLCGGCQIRIPRSIHYPIQSRLQTQLGVCSLYVERNNDTGQYY